MKHKFISTIVASILAFSMLTSCGSSNGSSNNQNTATSTTQSNQEILNSTKEITNSSPYDGDKILNNTADTESESNEHYDNAKNESTSNSISSNSTVETANKLITQVGIYIDQIGDNYIKLTVDKKNSSYTVSNDIINYIETELSKGTTVNFTYYKNDKNQNQITKIEKKYYSYTDGSGTYVGQIDNNSVEIIDTNTGKYVTYRLAEQTKNIISKIQEKQNIQFVYYKTKSNQLVISDIPGYTEGSTIVNSVGFFTGINSNLIEIKDYNTGKLEFYRLTDDIKIIIEKINHNSKINFTYYINENNQKVINGIKEI